jgi:hypothetical protein
MGSSFMGTGRPGYGEAAPGDHLQTDYRLWLPGNQLQHGRAPWVDPYSFRPEAKPSVNFAAWPFALPYWPLVAAFGHVWAWNLFVLLTYLAAGLFTCAWLRELGLPRGAALVGGLAFAIAPYRAMQSAGHLLGPVSMLLPLALWAFERGTKRGLGWFALAAAAIVSIPLSGQVHLALGAVPFFLAYALCRTRARRALVAAVAAAVAAAAAGLLIQRVSIAGSVSAGGRSLADVGRYSANVVDFLARHPTHGSERFVYLGLATPVLAFAGLRRLWQERRRALAWLLGLGVLVPVLLAFGTNLPTYSVLWHAFPPFRFPRVPERMMPVACLAIAALVAFAVTRFRWARIAPLLVALVLFADLDTRVYSASDADPGNAAYAAIARQPPGRVLELPVFTPDVHYGSVYLYYGIQAERQRPLGYSTLAPKSVNALVRRLQPLDCGEWPAGTQPLLDRLGIRYLAIHGGVYTLSFIPDASWFAWRSLVRHGWRPFAHGGRIAALRRGPGSTANPLHEPLRSLPFFCQGWFVQSDNGIWMIQTHASLWLYGARRVELRFKSIVPLRARIRLDGESVFHALVHTPATATLRLRGKRWHLVTFDVPRLVSTTKDKVGVKLLSLRRLATSPLR